LGLRGDQPLTNERRRLGHKGILRCLLDQCSGRCAVELVFVNETDRATALALRRLLVHSVQCRCYSVSVLFGVGLTVVYAWLCRLEHAGRKANTPITGPTDSTSYR